MVLRMERVRARFERWLGEQDDFPDGVAKDAAVSAEAVRRWKRDRVWPSMQSALRLHAKRGLDLHGLVE